jgi:hypothetical protein
MVLCYDNCDFPMKIHQTFLMLAAAACGCFYPPTPRPLPTKSTEVTIATPFDLTWDAVKAVASANNFKVIAENPDRGIVETQATGGFTLAAADCGVLKGIVGKYKAEPDADASAVYNFVVKPQGNEASLVSLQATFTAPLHIPMHRMSDVQCVSRGTEEARLLQQISEQAIAERRPFIVHEGNGPSLLPEATGDNGERPRGGIAK